MKLSKDFLLEEFTASATATAKNISNVPNPEQVENIKQLVQNLLQPIREALQLPITVISGYRSPLLNQAVGGAANSQHMKGEAADLTCSNNALLFDTIRKSELFDQLIWEFGNDLAPDWVHVSHSAVKNRSEVLRAVKTASGKTKYIRL